MAGPHPRVSDFVGLQWSLRSYVSDRFPGNVDLAALESTR